MASLSTCLTLAYAFLGLGTFHSALGITGVEAAAPKINARLQDELNWGWTRFTSRKYTSLTQDVVPKRIHSHNDHWRQVPFYNALSAGAISLDVNVWLQDGRILVGDDPDHLDPNFDFRSMYISPIASILREHNPSPSPYPPASLLDMRSTSKPKKRGLFNMNPRQTFFLFVDVKSDGVETWPVVVNELDILRQAGYLSYVHDGECFAGPVTVIGSGNTPRHLIDGVDRRDYFWDAPWSEFDNTTPSNLTALVSPFTSAFLLDVLSRPEIELSGLSTDQRMRIKQKRDEPKNKRIMTRLKGLPSWPISKRNNVWRDLISMDTNLITVDDLAAAAEDIW